MFVYLVEGVEKEWGSEGGVVISRGVECARNEIKPRGIDDCCPEKSVKRGKNKSSKHEKGVRNPGFEPGSLAIPRGDGKREF